MAFDPVQQAWQAPAAPDDLPVATLVARVAHTVPGAQEIRRLPSGAIVVFSFAGDEAQASYIDPADGRVLGPWQPSALPRWVKNLHRSLLLGDAGRWGAAGIALGMGLLSVSGLVLLMRRMGGWRRLATRVRGTLAQRTHVVMGLVALEAGPEPDVVSAVPVVAAGTGQAALPGEQPVMPLSMSAQNLRKLNIPDPTDPHDTWKVATDQGQAWIDRYSGQTLAWQGNTLAQRIYDWALVLHTGEGAWAWAVVLGLVGACVLVFWASGVAMWWQARRLAPHITGNSHLAHADILIFVASEGGSTWGFAQTLQDALRQGGHKVHTSALEHFQTTAVTRQVFVLAATYGDGQSPAHASNALEHIAKLSPGASPIPVTVLGFGDRQFGAFCAFAEALEQTLRGQGWPALLPLERIHQQSGQQFAHWGETLAQALGEPLVLDHVPRIPPTTALTLASRQDFSGPPEPTPQPAAILRFSWPAQSLGARLRRIGLARFAAGDLVGIVSPGSAVPRYYSLASGSEDGFVEICARLMPGGLCSTHLLGLQPGATMAGFIRANPGFTLPHTQRPVVLIGAGTGMAPLAGFIRRNDRHIPMHLFFGGRDPALDFYFGPEIQGWLGEGRLATVQTAFSRVPNGGGYVLAPLQLTVLQLKAKDRYAEDIF